MYKGQGHVALQANNEVHDHGFEKLSVAMRKKLGNVEWRSPLLLANTRTFP